MASPAPFIERRRASRVLIRIPITVFSNTLDGSPIHAPAEALAVSRYGALLRAPIAPALGTTIEVLNGLSQEVQEFRVIRISEADRDGYYDLGVEILGPRDNFWGIDFPTPPRPS